ncbi:MAG: hypothetical protein ACD_73C00644G0001 [uncultured bacterium]|nr:MAG: hypothetical protein ACD_73C00644G0001 [uncultured bacterium]
MIKAKATHLQMRVSVSQKKQLFHLARQADMTMSEWILQKIFPPKKEEWDALITKLSLARDKSFVLAELNDFMTALGASELKEVFDHLPHNKLNDYWLNYLTAMVEHTSKLKGIAPPAWVFSVPPLDKPVFASELPSLRLYLLVNSPPAFRSRNIFVDSTIGARV